jgi:hypothetical protein
MWTNENRSLYDRGKLRYPSDLTDDEWALIEPLIPPAKRGGGKRTADMREVVNGLMYVLSTGCQWRAIPKDLPPRSTVHGYISTFGTGMARSIASTMLCMSNAVSTPSVKQAPQPLLSTVKA